MIPDLATPPSASGLIPHNNSHECVIGGIGRECCEQISWQIRVNEPHKVSVCTSGVAELKEIVILRGRRTPQTLTQAKI